MVYENTSNGSWYVEIREIEDLKIIRKEIKRDILKFGYENLTINPKKQAEKWLTDEKIARLEEKNT